MFTLDTSVSQWPSTIVVATSSLSERDSNFSKAWLNALQNFPPWKVNDSGVEMNNGGFVT